MVCNTAKKGFGRLLSDLDLSAEISIMLPFSFVSVLVGGRCLRDAGFGSRQAKSPHPNKNKIDWVIVCGELG
jgi:hypothetical protein